MKNWSLSRRLAGVFAAIALIALPAATVSLWMLTQSSNRLEYVVAN